MRELYILTDAHGFTTSCEPSMECLMREAARVPLMAPITVRHWVIKHAEVYRTSLHDRWVLAQTFVWNGRA